MTDDDLLRLGLVRMEDGSFLVRPTAAATRFVPIGRFIEIQISSVSDSHLNVIKVVVARDALKIHATVKL
jgi:hypothetical protein